MSGGTFYYVQYRMDEALEILISKSVDPDYTYSEQVEEKIQEAIKQLKLATIYLHRVDWLMAGDDGEETFLKRLDEEISEFKENWS